MAQVRIFLSTVSAEFRIPAVPSDVGLGDLHVHDLRHTVGMRLREAGVVEAMVADILWHRRRSVTAHYSHVQVLQVRAALELISQESGRENWSLRSLAKGVRGRRVPPGSLQDEKTG